MSSKKPNFYDTLGVDNNASESEIKKAYRTLSLKYHPDRNPSEDAKSKFQEIGEAYETLSDDQRRKQYDMELNGFPFSDMGPGMGQGMDDINNIFNMMFGGAMHGMGNGMGPGMGPGIRIFHQNSGPGGVHHVHFGGPGGMPNIFQNMQKPPPIIKNVRIDITQSYQGCSLPLEIERWVIENNVKTVEKEVIYVPIHQGIDDNEIIILRDRGNVANEMLKGDVKIVVQIENNSQFKRNGLDLIYTHKLTLKESLCGFTFEAQHLNGKKMNLTNINNRNIIAPNSKKIIPNLGMIRDNQTGNLIIEFEVVFPTSLTLEQIGILETAL